MFLVFVVGGFFVHPPWLFDQPNLTKRGMIDAIVPRLQMRERLAQIISLLG